MSDYQAKEAFIVEQAFDANSADQLHPLGFIIRAEDTATTDYGMGEFIYLPGIASVAVGEWVLYSADDWATSLLAANDIGPVAVAMAAIVANEFGWFQISGKAVGLALSGFADNADVYSTSTAGSVDDAVVAGDRVQNCKGASALDTPATGQAEFEIHRPFVNNALAD